MGGSSSGLSSLDTRTRLGAPGHRCAAVHALWTAPEAAAPPFCAVSALPQPACEVGPLGGHRAPSAGKTQHRAQQIRAAARGATPRRILDRPPRRAAWMGRDSDGFWTAPRAVPPGWGEAQTDFGPPHPQDASPSCGSGTPTPVVRWRSRRTVRWRFPRPRPIASGQATTYMSRQPPGSSRASPGHNHPLGQATAYWGRQIAYPNAQFPTPMPGAGARQDPPHSSARLGTPTGEHPGRSHWLSARTGPPPPPPCRLGLGALDERTVE